MKKLFYALLMVLVLAIAGCQTIPVTPANTTTISNDTSAVLIETPIDTQAPQTTEPKPKTEEKVAQTFTFKEGDVIKVKDNIAYDPDGDDLVYSFTSPLDKNGEWSTKIGDAGEYITTITVSDGKLASSLKVKLIIKSTNKVPTISDFEDITVDEGDMIKLTPVVADPDGDKVTTTLSGFMTSDTYQTTYKDSGVYKQTLTATDGKQTVSKTITVTVKDINRAPTLSPIADITVIEGQAINVSGKAEDADGDDVEITFSKPLNSKGDWTTKTGDAGTYQIDVIASDGNLETKRTFKVTVKIFNRAPTLQVPASIDVAEGDVVEIAPIVADADGDALKVTYSGFMNTASYQTTYGDAGEYTTKVSVTDGKEVVTKTVAITITKVNRAPQFRNETIVE